MRINGLLKVGLVLAVVGGVSVWFGGDEAGANAGAATNAPAKAVDFNRDVRPILSDNCYACHGPDDKARKADLRLDTKEGLFSEIDGKRVVAPGKSGESELIARIAHEDSTERMPPGKSGKKLTGAQIETLKKWVEQGAVWKTHWAYEPVKKPQVPVLPAGKDARNEIDRFVLAKLAEAGLESAKEADRVTLIRRLSFDLLGLPPTAQEVREFVGDRRPDAYERLVERLMARPQFGERMAVFWLDLVRYADTIGYHSDNPRNISPYRDYVINSFNSNKPFDLFTVEQLAGDLLADAGVWQKVASGYNRLLQTTEEGGAQPKEYTAKYASDRVRNVSSAWMGATLGCAECHDHKFDPYTARDFYSMAAFFADVEEAAVGKREPGMPVPDERQEKELARLDAAIAAGKKKIEEATPELVAAQAQWEKQLVADPIEWITLEPVSWDVRGESKLKKIEGGILQSVYKLAAQETFTVVLKADLKKATAIRLEALDDDALPNRGPGGSPSGNFVLTEFKVTAPGAERKAVPVKLKNARADYSQDGYPVGNAIDGKNDTGWAVQPQFGKPHEAVFEIEGDKLADGAGDVQVALEFNSRFPQHQIAKFRLTVTEDKELGSRWLPPKIRELVKVEDAKRSEAQQKELAGYFRSVTPLLADARKETASLQQQREELVRGMRMTLVTTAMRTPRTVRILPRGNWLDDSGEVVKPAVPAFLGSLKSSGERATRLDLAKWLVSRENPLTARVFVNRVWRLYLGQGLSRSMEDFGAQGEPATHPELLDWLAADFMDNGWDVKRLIKQMVTSATYRQSSTPTTAMKEKDPENRLLARQNRFRLEGEFVRDNALFVSGLLNSQIGGESVKPYQPAGYWDFLNFPKRTWEHDRDARQWRRGLYTHWQRTFLHPSLRAFDASTREECTAERARSNIPQQALTLLNDPTYVEAARALATRIVQEGEKDVKGRVEWAFEQVTNRRPRDAEVKVLVELYEAQWKVYGADEKAAQSLVSTGEAPLPQGAEVKELATWTAVARAMLNLHETITRY